MGDGRGSGPQATQAVPVVTTAAEEPATQAASAEETPRPGPALADEILRGLQTCFADSAAGSATAVVQLVTSGFRLEGWALWTQLSAIAVLLRRWRADPPAEHADDAPSTAGRDGTADAAMAERAATAWDQAIRRARSRAPRAVDLVEDCIAAEVSLACGLSQLRAHDRVLAADIVLVQRRLPRTAQLLREGLLDWPKIQLLTHRLGVGTHPLLAAAVEHVLIPDADLDAELPRITRMRLPALAQAIEATILALDAEAAAERARDARARRCVTTRPEPDGTASLQATTGAEQVAEMWNSLTSAAQRAKRAGDARTVDQLRLDELVARVTGRTGVSAPEGAAVRPSGRSPAGPPSSAEGSRRSEASPPTDPSPTTGSSSRTEPSPPTGSPSSTEPSPPTKWSPPTKSSPLTEPSDCSVRSGGGLAVGLTMPLATFLAVADDPAILDGYGPVAAAIARQIARDASRDAPLTTTWRCVVTDDEHRTVLGVGRPVSTPRHDPPPRLAELVRRTHPFCVFPGCRVPAQRCDLDHRVPYDPHDAAGDREGGVTCSCNLAPLCRRHHRLRTAGLVNVQYEPPRADVHGTDERPGQHADPHADQTDQTDRADHGEAAHSGRFVWTTSTGLRYVSEAEPPTPPPAPRPPDIDDLLRRLTEGRAADEGVTAWMNNALRAAYRRGVQDERTQAQADLEEALAAEVRHHDYGEIVDRADLDPTAEPPVPEPEDLIPSPPRWLMRLPHPPLNDDIDDPVDADDDLAASA